MTIDHVRTPPPSARRAAWKPRGLLFHYTTLDGFLGILESDVLRATHIRYMNDSREFVDALDHTGSLANALAHEFERYGLSDSLRTKLGEFLGSISSIISGRSGAYVASFTDDAAQESASGELPGDRLSQWRAYGGGSKGISLGFDFDALHGNMPGESWSLGGCTAYLLDCLYKSEEKQKALLSVADVVIPDLRRAFETIESPPVRESEIQSTLKAFRWQMILGWIINASTFKDPAFSEEKEWRIVMFGPGSKVPEDEDGESGFRLSFRNGPLGITPYRELPLRLSAPTSPLRRVVIGPTPHLQDSVKAVEMVLEERGVALRSEKHPTGIDVVPSRIPYRIW